MLAVAPALNRCPARHSAVACSEHTRTHSTQQSGQCRAVWSRSDTHVATGGGQKTHTHTHTSHTHNSAGRWPAQQRSKHVGLSEGQGEIGPEEAGGAVGGELGAAGRVVVCGCRDCRGCGCGRERRRRGPRRRRRREEVEQQAPPRDDDDDDDGWGSPKDDGRRRRAPSRRRRRWCVDRSLSPSRQPTRAPAGSPCLAAARPRRARSAKILLTFRVALDVRKDL